MKRFVKPAIRAGKIGAVIWLATALVMEGLKYAGLSFAALNIGVVIAALLNMNTVIVAIFVVAIIWVVLGLISEQLGKYIK